MRTMGGSVPTMKVVVTGADGMLGSYICRVALEQGHVVRAFLQPDRSTGTLEGLPVEPFTGDILDAGRLRDGLTGCDAVIHTVASTDVWPARSALVRRLNYDAVVGLAAAVRACGLTRFVHIGTANSFGPGSIDAPGTEDSPYTDGRFGLDYQDSKFAAQEWLLEQHRESGLPVVVINPSFMFGAYDSKPGSGQMILAICRGRTPGYPRGGKSYAHARDVAVAAVHALTRGTPGRCYLAGGENLSYRDAFSVIAEVAGVTPPRLPLPSVLTIAAGCAGSLIAAVTRRRPTLSLPMARLAITECYYSSARAISELGMPQTPMRQAVADAIAWFREHGYLEAEQ